MPQQCGDDVQNTVASIQAASDSEDDGEEAIMVRAFFRPLDPKSAEEYRNRQEEKKQKKEERRMVRGRLSEARPPRVQGCGKSRVGLLMDLWKFMVGRRDGWRNHK